MFVRVRQARGPKTEFNVPAVMVDRFPEKYVVVGNEPIPDESWTVAALKAHAEEQGIDLADAKKKSDILAAIHAA